MKKFKCKVCNAVFEAESLETAVLTRSEEQIGRAHV